MRLATICSSRLLIPILIVVALAQTLPAGGQELVEVGSMPYGPCYATALNSARDVAFLGNGSVLQAVDVFSPLEPVLVGELQLPGAVHDLFYGGERLYVANGHGGLRVITMEYETDDAGMVTKVEFTEIGSVVGSLTDARNLDIVNNRAYIANGRHGLAVVDVEDPTQPELLGSYPMSGEALEVAVHPATERAYVAAGVVSERSGLFIIDVQDPASMQEITHTYDATDVSSVAVVGNLLYVLDRTNEKGLCVITGINTNTPVQHLYFDTGGDKVSITVHNSSTLNQIVFVADGASGVSIVDVTDPDGFQMKSGGFIGGGDHLDTPGFAAKVYATPGTDTTLVADDNGGLRIVGKIGNMEGLWEMSFYDTPGLARGIAISGDVAYIADGDGVRVYDVSSPLAFPELGMVALAKDFKGIAASGNVAYVTAPDGLHLVDATKPSTITTTPIFEELGNEDIPARKVAVVNNVLSMTNGDPDNGIILCILDVTTPSQPRDLDYPSMPPSLGLGIAMDKDMTYVAGSDGLYAIDRNKLPGTLRSIGSLNSSVRVAVLGGYAYVTDADGLCILDVANAVDGAAARLTGRWPNPLSLTPTTVAVAGPTVYAVGENTLHQTVYAVGDNTLHVIDVTRVKNAEGVESDTITELAPLTLPLDKEGDILATSGNRVYVIAGAAGVRIYGVDRDAPVANAGADISLFSGFTAYLNAEASTDDVAVMKYNWRCLNSNIVPSDGDKSEARFITPKVSQPTQYEFELTVEDKAGRTSTDTMVVTVKPYTGRGEPSSGSSGCTLSPEAGFRAEWLFLAGLMAVLRLRRRKR
ncbi:PKD domain-containing protein [Desulfocurvibacter africanus]|uniref:PKD domain-containing protein n=1 Tax=Desulfocurvibacter africanus TaxID=873 RepID=UPI0004120E33|nr:hypothetical protein [Desulfocurvibacter africanus]